MVDMHLPKQVRLALRYAALDTVRHPKRVLLQRLEKAPAILESSWTSFPLPLQTRPPMTNLAVYGPEHVGAATTPRAMTSI